MLLASPALRKLGSVAGTGGGGGGMTARKKWGGAGALGALFTPSAVRGLSRDAQVGGVAAKMTMVVVVAAAVGWLLSSQFHSGDDRSAI